MPRLVLASAVLLLAACADPSSAPSPSPLGGTEAPLLAAAVPGAPIPGAYIVVLRDAPGLQRAADVARGIGVRAGALRHSYDDALRGFAATLEPAERARIARDPRVAYVEEDRVVSIATVQGSAPWGLDRLDQRALPLTGTFYYARTGAGVRAYIIDTGIRTTHHEFTGRMATGYDAITAGGSASDCHGHGTHVAATTAGTTYGVAKRATLHPVRVLDCQGNGTTSGVIAGVNWVTANAVRPAVANMSLGGGVSSSLDQAVANSITKGITYTIAAGNANLNACNFSPARVAAAITVGASTSSDARASFSNFGSCLDLFAPGASIRSAWHTSNTASATLSGTSMAAPHAAGVAALYLQGSPGASPATVAYALQENSTRNRLTSIGSGSPNMLLYTRY